MSDLLVLMYEYEMNNEDIFYSLRCEQNCPYPMDEKWGYAQWNFKKKLFGHGQREEPSKFCPLV